MLAPDRLHHGLVIGKFYPPHAGHHLLVRTAASVCDRLTVLVMASSVETISLEQRVAWMREVHPDVTVRGVVDDHPIDLQSDAVWSAHVALMRTETPVDAVFTSEAYGEELGRRLGARAITLDLARELVPISATRVREDPAAAWEFLAPPVRAGLARRVVVVGAESTGKTTFARGLAEALRRRGGSYGLTRSVPEVGRDVTVDKLARARALAGWQGRPTPLVDDLVWTTDDFLAIAAAQNAAEDAEARIGGPVLVCDTDAFATGVWHERYMGSRSAAVEAHGRSAHLTLLTHHDDVPFADDGLRDGEGIRAWMTATFVERLPPGWQWLRGGPEERLATALAAIDALR